VVALLDSGVDLEHPELKAKLLPGYNAADPYLLPAPSQGRANAHGTACAGLIAAEGRHALGVAPRCSLIPIRIGDFSGEYLWCAPEAIARGIHFAASHGAWVISNSYGGPLPEVGVSKSLADAIHHGRNGRGCVVVSSTGNSNGPVMFPARDKGVIAVAATGSDGKRWVTNTHGSCFGPEVSVAAPGSRLWTTDIRGPRGYTALPPGPGADYTEFSGTSAATPLVAGVAALILSINPNLTAFEVRQILEMTALPPGGAPKPNIFLGHGLVNAFAAVQEARRRLLQS
jgi:subtilisin family serine protease